ncbi:MAG: hypothetical protein KJ077_27815 [Anaerolineae bacterium]|nr:hypothetical protein [Anaerolineae bacterium]
MSIIIPIQDANILGGTVNDVELLYAQLEQTAPADQYILDMLTVNFVRPYGVIALICVARRLAALCNKPVLLKNLLADVHSYLHFMKLFEIGADFIHTVEPLKQIWQPAATPDQLHLTIAVNPASVETIAAQAKSIFARWLLTSNLGNLLNVISELCANIYQHSGDSQGCILIQKYKSRTRGRIEVRLAAGDLGQGIRGSLSARHETIGPEPLDYLRAAMQGMSARPSGRGGMGLRRVEQIVEAEGGYLWLRSETAAILSQGPGKVQEYSNLVYMSGTQVAVELHAPLHD